MENPLLRMRGARDVDVTPVPRTQSATARSGLDHSYVYAAIFALLGCAVAIWLSHSLQNLLFSPALKPLIFLVISAGLLSVIFIFQSLLINSKFWNMTLIIFESLALLGSFYSTISIWIIAAAVLFCVLSLRTYLTQHIRLEEDMRFQFFRYASRFCGLFFTGFTLFCALLLVGMFQSGGGVSERMFELLLKGVTPAISYSLKMPVDETTTIEGVVQTYLSKEFSKRNEYSQLSPLQRQQTLALSTAEAVNRLGEQIGTPIAPHETLDMYLYRLLDQLIFRVNALHLGPFITIAFLLFASLFIRSLLIFIKIPALLLAQLIYAGLSSMGIISIATEPRLKEVLVIK